MDNERSSHKGATEKSQTANPAQESDNCTQVKAVLRLHWGVAYNIEFPADVQAGALVSAILKKMGIIHEYPSGGTTVWCLHVTDGGRFISKLNSKDVVGDYIRNVKALELNLLPELCAG